MGMRKMKRWMVRYLLIGGTTLAGLWFVHAPAFAQAPPPGSVGKVTEHTSAGSENWHRLPPGGPAPKTKDGHPDLSGVFFPNAAGRQVQRAYPIDPEARRQYDPKVTPEGKPELKPGSQEKYKQVRTYGECTLPNTP